MKWEYKIDFVTFSPGQGLNPATGAELEKKYIGKKYKILCSEDDIENILRGIIEDESSYQVEDLDGTYHDL